MVESLPCSCYQWESFDAFSFFFLILSSLSKMIAIDFVDILQHVEEVPLYSKFIRIFFYH